MANKTIKINPAKTGPLDCHSRESGNPGFEWRLTYLLYGRAGVGVKIL